MEDADRGLDFYGRSSFGRLVSIEYMYFFSCAIFFWLSPSIRPM